MSFQINPFIFDWNWPFAKILRYLCYVRQAMVLSLSVKYIVEQIVNWNVPTDKTEQVLKVWNILSFQIW